MSVRSALKLLRIELGMTQADLAKKLNKGHITVNRWENGNGFPSRNNSKEIISLAIQKGASDECVSYLYEVLMPDFKRSTTAASYGFADIDREFMFNLADSSVNSVYVIDAKTYELLYANRTAERSAINYITRDGTPLADRKLACQTDKRCFHYFAGKTEPCSFCPLKEFDDKSYKDKTITIPESGRQLRLHAKFEKMNNRDVFVVYLTDITATNAELNALYALTNDIPEGVGIYNVYFDHTIQLVFTNTILLQMIGKQRQKEMLDSPRITLSIIHPDDRPRLMNAIKDSVYHKRDINIDINMSIYNEPYQIINLTGRMIKKDTEKITFYCLFRKKNKDK